MKFVHRKVRGVMEVDELDPFAEVASAAAAPRRRTLRRVLPAAIAALALAGGAWLAYRHYVYREPDRLPVQLGELACKRAELDPETACRCLKVLERRPPDGSALRDRLDEAAPYVAACRTLELAGRSPEVQTLLLNHALAAVLVDPEKLELSFIRQVLTEGHLHEGPESTWYPAVSPGERDVVRWTLALIQKPNPAAVELAKPTARFTPKERRDSVQLLKTLERIGLAMPCAREWVRARKSAVRSEDWGAAREACLGRGREVPDWLRICAAADIPQQRDDGSVPVLAPLPSGSVTCAVASKFEALILATPALDELSRAHLALQAEDRATFEQVLGHPEKLSPPYLKLLDLLAPSDEADRKKMAAGLRPEELEAMNLFLHTPWQVVPGEPEPLHYPGPRRPELQGGRTSKAGAEPQALNGRVQRLSLRNATAAACALLGMPWVNISADRIRWTQPPALARLEKGQLEVERAELANTLLELDPSDRDLARSACAFSAALTLLRAGDEGARSALASELARKWAALRRANGATKSAAETYCAVVADFGDTGATSTAIEELRRVDSDAAVPCRIQSLFWRVARNEGPSARAALLDLRRILGGPQQIPLISLVEIRFPTRKDRPQSTREIAAIFTDIHARFSLNRYAAGIRAAEEKMLAGGAR